MCGRFALDDKVNTLITDFVEAGNDFRDWRPNFNISPTDESPLVREWADGTTGEVHRAVDVATWDFTPPFLKGKSKRPQINARIETVDKLGLFKGAFLSSRCLVPMNGYYEWSGPKENRQPHFIHGPEEYLMAAGLYTGRKNDDGEWDHSFVIITREARDASGEIHDRMPAFLTRDVWDEWMQPGKLADPEKILAMLYTVSEGVAASVTTYPVSKVISNSRARDDWSDPTLIDPIELD